MFKTTILLKTIVIAAVATVALPTLASAYVHHTGHAAHHYKILHQSVEDRTIQADGSCDGVIDGSGLTHNCGTATGGVPGGMPNRN